MDVRNPITEQEQLEVQQALLDGHQAGRLDVPAGANPHEVGSRKYQEWERGRRTVTAARLAHILRAKARLAAPCRYNAALECTCGGRGLCLDVA